MNVGVRGRSEEMKEEEMGRPVVDGDSSDIVRPCPLLRPRGANKFKCDDGERCPGAVSAAAPHRHLCQSRNTRSPARGNPRFCSLLCN